MAARRAQWAAAGKNPSSSNVRATPAAAEALDGSSTDARRNARSAKDRSCFLDASSAALICDAASVLRDERLFHHDPRAEQDGFGGLAGIGERQRIAQEKLSALFIGGQLHGFPRVLDGLLRIAPGEHQARDPDQDLSVRGIETQAHAVLALDLVEIPAHQRSTRGAQLIVRGAGVDAGIRPHRAEEGLASRRIGKRVGIGGGDLHRCWWRLGFFLRRRRRRRRLRSCDGLGRRCHGLCRWSGRVRALHAHSESCEIEHGSAQEQHAEQASDAKPDRRQEPALPLHTCHGFHGARIGRSGHRHAGRDGRRLGIRHVQGDVARCHDVGHRGLLCRIDVNSPRAHHHHRGQCRRAGELPVLVADSLPRRAHDQSVGHIHRHPHTRMLER